MNKNHKIIILVICTMIFLIFFGIFIKPEYALDTYVILNNPVKHITGALSQGRFLKGLFYVFILNNGMSFSIKYIVSYILAMICTIISIFKLNSIISKNITNKIISLIISTLIIINPFSIELMLFYEKGIMWLGVLSTVYALDFFIKFLEEKKKKNILLSMLFMIISVFSYQGVSSLFLSLAALYIIKRYKNIKSFIVNNIYMGLIYAIPAIINVMIVRFIFVDSRVSGKIIIIDTIKAIINQIPSMLHSFYILPGVTFIISILCVFLLLLFSVFVYTKKKKKLLILLGAIYAIIVNFMGTIAPQLLQNTESVWLVPRATYAFGATIGIIILYSYLNTNIQDNIKINKLLCILIIPFMFIQIYGFYSISIEHYITNYKDKMNALDIGKKIRDYEQETGKKIKYITYSEDRSKSYTYPIITGKKDTNLSALSYEWSTIDAINYYNGINLKQKKSSKKIKEDCSKTNTDDFDIDKSIIEKNVFNYCGF